MLETSAGTAKYEHVLHSLVWRIPRLPKEGQGQSFSHPCSPFSYMIVQVPTLSNS